MCYLSKLCWEHTEPRTSTAAMHFYIASARDVQDLCEGFVGLKRRLPNAISVCCTRSPGNALRANNAGRS